MILPALFLLHAQGFLLPARDRSTVCPNASARPCRRAVDPCSWVLFATLLEERASFHVSGAYPVSRYADECLWFCPFVAAADPMNDLLLLESFEPPESGFVGHYHSCTLLASKSRPDCSRGHSFILRRIQELPVRLMHSTTHSASLCLIASRR